MVSDPAVLAVFRVVTRPRILVEFRIRVSDDDGALRSCRRELLLGLVLWYVLS